MNIFLAVMAYAFIGIWYVHRKRKGGVKRHHLLISYTIFLPIFLPILLVHTVIYLANRPWKRRQP